MKIFIFVLFIAIPSYAQNFMMDMAVSEIYKDTAIYHRNIEVIWGIQDKEICLLWADYTPICFTKKKQGLSYSKKIREKIEEVLKRLEYEKKEGEWKTKNIQARDIFQNQWGEVFIITIYVDEGVMISINRLDDNFPNYFFSMTR